MAPRQAVNLDDVDVDFSGVTAPAPSTTRHTSSSASPLSVLDRLDAVESHTSTTHGSELARAYDPGMAGYVHQRYAQPRRRRATLFAPVPHTESHTQPAHSAAAAAAHTNVSRVHAPPRATQGDEMGERVMHKRPRVHDAPTTPSAELTALLSSGSAAGVSEHTEEKRTATLAAAEQEKEAACVGAYLHELRAFCHTQGSARSVASSRTSNTISKTETHARWPSVLRQGVPDIEPWDRWAFVLPRYDNMANMYDDTTTTTTTNHVGQYDSYAYTAMQRDAVGKEVSHRVRLPETYFARWQRRAAAAHVTECCDVSAPSRSTMQTSSSSAATATSAAASSSSNAANGHAHVVESSVQYSLKFKTKEELRAERRSRLAERHARERKAASASTVAALTRTEDNSNNNSTNNDSNEHGQFISRTTAHAHNRLSNKALVHGLLTRSVLNPLGAEGSVYAQYEQRFHDHQRRNHDRHVAALPHQLAKRAQDTVRRARERPVLRAYRIFPVFQPAHLGKLRHYANDQKLRGFILWVGRVDALVVLSGGESACRHMDRWIMQKMQWQHAQTRASRLCSLPLPDAQMFSFCLPPSASYSSASSKVTRVGEEGEKAGGVMIRLWAWAPRRIRSRRRKRCL